MFVMATLEQDYEWVVAPSEQRLKLLAVNQNPNQGMRQYTELSPAEVWADMFQPDVGDDGERIGIYGGSNDVTLPLLPDNAGHKPDLSIPKKKRKRGEKRKTKAELLQEKKDKERAEDSDFLASDVESIAPGGETPVAHRRPSKKGHLPSQELTYEGTAHFLSPPPSPVRGRGRGRGRARGRGRGRAFAVPARRGRGPVRGRGQASPVSDGEDIDATDL